ncbi:MAG: L-serine ammonia-lyase, iron-sulfur-dependent, subunit alpha [Oscillospiraceae bacterium]|nr:L-serine ammonia-lyase, iron-sulfur-dependent, subunit alpha [Oscillospiraceae bacterium]
MRTHMHETLRVMREAIAAGLSDKDARSHSGMSGGNACRMKSFIDSGSIEDNVYNRATVYALATSETNANMGKIVAAPTAGASGILPAVLIAFSELNRVDDERVVDALYLTGDIGMKIAKTASLSGAECGCQAECGSAAAMAAAGLAFLMGGTYEQSENAAALALKSLLGLVCDPVAGLVEVPCIKRNATGTSVAITSANMSMAGIESVIPFDEVLVAMKQVGRTMPEQLRETAQGGCAVTATGMRIARSLGLKQRRGDESGTFVRE